VSFLETVIVGNEVSSVKVKVKTTKFKVKELETSRH